MAELCRKEGISESIIANWKAKIVVFPLIAMEICASFPGGGILSAFHA
jgi:hypothetical protein